MYPIWVHIKYLFTRRNYHGFGIHSPFLFKIINSILPAPYPYYCFKYIEKQRGKLLIDKRPILIDDLGSGGIKYNKHYITPINEIAKRSLMPSKKAQQLFKLLGVLHRPCCCIELGTSFGITTAYLAKVNSRNKIYTFDACKSVENIAHNVWTTLKIEKNITQIHGDITTTLPTFLTTTKPIIDFVCIDANHRYVPTISYFKTLIPYLNEHSIVVLDDIHSNREMGRAWYEISKMSVVTTAIDLFSYGILFFDTHYLHKTYIC